MLNWEFSCNETHQKRDCGPRRSQHATVSRGADPDMTHEATIAWWKAHGKQVCGLQWSTTGYRSGPQERATEGWTYAGCVDAAYCNTVLALEMAFRSNEALEVGLSVYPTGWEVENFHKTYMARTLWQCGQEDDGSFCAELQGTTSWTELTGSQCEQFPRCTCDMLRIHERAKSTEMVKRIARTYLQNCTPCENVSALDSPYFAGGAGSQEAPAASTKRNEHCPRDTMTLDVASGSGLSFTVAAATALFVLLTRPTS